ncbi:DNA-binding protein [Mycobacteroides franklinii]|uniref:DNA-binding protein n=2 Tax=Mycobacteriaceae TaxID=1762 RepID=A0A4R5PEY6_9MYCO|nr:helix-turn-helix domain-containing protein [Mycobacteroides chelonae]TDH23922.1 DNA-binding protein [Mycobacteroides franklinii]
MGLLKVSRSTVYKLISDGVLRTAAVPRRTLIPASEIQRVLAVSA